MNRKAFSVVPLEESGHDLAYWLSRKPGESIAAVEAMRQIVYGREATSGHMKRVLTVAKLGDPD